MKHPVAICWPPKLYSNIILASSSISSPLLYCALLCLLRRDRSKLQVFVFKVPDFNRFLIMILKKNIAKEQTPTRLLHLRMAIPRLMTSVRCFWCFPSPFELLTHFGRLIMELDQTQKAWWMINLSRIEINANKASHEPLELGGEWHDFSRSSYANRSHYVCFKILKLKTLYK